ncbi:MAG: chromate efflux transporter [Betaproteobacteria bacterium]|nr:chromate efflux transporter [Betaproteobacteria bacterium]
MNPKPVSCGVIFRIFLRLGLTSFGGPMAHLGYFRNEFVLRRRWLSDPAYADLVALCQFLPGPASSQVGIGLGLQQRGLRGALSAWAGFTLPSALLLILFALTLGLAPSFTHSGWFHGLKLVTVAVVAQAVWGMARTLCPDALRRLMMVGAAVLLLQLPGVATQLLVLAAGALLGIALLKPSLPEGPDLLVVPVSRFQGLAALALFALLLAGLPLLASVFPSQGLALFERFYRAGALVFGGGHVVLPLLQTLVVTPGWVSNDTFLAGYGAAQAVPGPLFTFAAYLGAVMGPAPHGWLGGLLCLAAIFLPSFLLVTGILPFWDELRRQPRVRAALAGVNAVVVGLLLAALWNPVWTSAIGSVTDVLVALGALALLQVARWPSWAVVVLCAGAGMVLA